MPEAGRLRPAADPRLRRGHSQPEFVKRELQEFAVRGLERTLCRPCAASAVTSCECRSQPTPSGDTTWPRGDAAALGTGRRHVDPTPSGRGHRIDIAHEPRRATSDRHLANECPGAWAPRRAVSLRSARARAARPTSTLEVARRRGGFVRAPLLGLHHVAANTTPGRGQVSLCLTMRRLSACRVTPRSFAASTMLPA